MNYQEKPIMVGKRENEGFSATTIAEFKGKEIPVGFSGFFELPLTTPIYAPGFVRCPAGIAVTEQKLWLVHMPFLYQHDDDKFWQTWRTYEKSSPKHLLAFSSDIDMGRLVALTNSMERKTGKKVSASVNIAENQDIFDLSINQEGGIISVRFEERNNPDNALTETLTT